MSGEQGALTMRRCNLIAWSLLFGVVGLPLTAHRSPLAAQDLERGEAIYDKWCAGCHGESGAGDGEAAAFMHPPPREFSLALYQIRTTASGELPTDRDIRWVIDKGMPGTAMPGWESRLSEGDRNDVMAYIKSFSRFFDGNAPEPLDFGKALGSNEAGIAEGERVYRELECFTCHGDAGRGDGPSAPTLTDDWDFPIRAADLTEPWNFNGGASVEDIYRRLRTGLDGTPMPSFSDVIEAQMISDEQLWRVAQYVRSLSRDDPPRVRDVVRAALVEGELPAGPDDETWADVEPYYIPLVGQIIVKPRWFAPMVDGIRVKALHNGDRLAMLLSWNDPSSSPDPEWQEWLDRMAQTMTDVDGPLPTEQGPDRLHVQFAMKLPTGLERPYFLGGDRRNHVYMWRWTSSPDKLEEGSAAGFDRFVPRSSATDVSHTARFEAGQWRLVISRALVPSDTNAATVFVTGRSIPMAFYAADGSNGEGEMRGSVSAWYAIYLDGPTPAMAYVTPLLAMLLTAGLGIMVVWRAQQRGRSVA